LLRLIPEGLVQEISRILVTRGTLTLVETTEIAPDGRAAITTASQLLAMLVNAGFTQADGVKDGDGWLTGSARQRARARLTNPGLIAATRRGLRTIRRPICYSYAHRTLSAKRVNSDRGSVAEKLIHADC
jgi:hypothetical protein